MAEATTYIPNPREQTTYAVLPGGDLGTGGTGGASIQQVYIDRAPAAPNNPALPALSYSSGGSPTQQWDVATQSWN